MMKKFNLAIFTAVIIFTTSFKITEFAGKLQPLPRDLKVVFAHNGNSPELHTEIANYISSKIGIKAEVLEIEKITDIITGLRNNEIDFAFMNTFGYILAKDDLKSALEPFVVMGKSDNIPGAYYSSIIAPANGKLQSISHLNGTTAKELNLVFAKPTSTSGHIIPRLYVNSRGLDKPEVQFKSVAFAAGHRDAISKIEDGTADLAAIATGFLQSEISAGNIPQGKIKILWTSGRIVEGPLVVRSNLNQQLKAVIKDLFLNMPQQNPQLWKKIQETYPSAAESSGYIIAQDEFYDPIRNLADRIEHLKLILKYYLKRYY